MFMFANHKSFQCLEQKRQTETVEKNINFYKWNFDPNVHTKHFMRIDVPLF